MAVRTGGREPGVIDLPTRKTGVAVEGRRDMATAAKRGSAARQMVAAHAFGDVAIVTGSASREVAIEHHVWKHRHRQESGGGVTLIARKPAGGHMVGGKTRGAHAVVADLAKAGLHHGMVELHRRKGTDVVTGIAAQ